MLQGRKMFDFRIVQESRMKIRGQIDREPRAGASTLYGTDHVDSNERTKLHQASVSACSRANEDLAMVTQTQRELVGWHAPK